MRTDQEVAVGVVEGSVLHRRVAGIVVNGDSAACHRITAAADRVKALEQAEFVDVAPSKCYLNEVHVVGLGHWERLPSQLVRVRLEVRELVGELVVFQRLKRPVHDRRTNAV